MFSLICTTILHNVRNMFIHHRGFQTAPGIISLVGENGRHNLWNWKVNKPRSRLNFELRQKMFYKNYKIILCTMRKFLQHESINALTKYIPQQSCISTTITTITEHANKNDITKCNHTIILKITPNQQVCATCINTR